MNFPPRIRRRLVLLTVATLAVLAIGFSFGWGTDDIIPDSGAAAVVVPSDDDGAVRGEIEAASGASNGAGPDGANPSESAPLDERVAVESAGARDYASIRGRVIDRFGQGIEGVRIDARVTLFPVSRRTERVESDVDGYFVIRGVRPGRARVNFRHPEYCDVSTKPSPVARGDRIELDPICMYVGTEITGYVRVDGEPAQGVQLWVLGDKTDGSRRTRPGSAVISGRDGFYRVRDRQPPGRYRVIAMPALQFGPFAKLNSARIVAAEFDLVAAERNRLVNVDLNTKR